MSSIVEAAVSPVRDLSPEESRAFFDAKARELLGISGAEFVRRWNAGEYDETADDPAHSDIMYLAMFLPPDRSVPSSQLVNRFDRRTISLTADFLKAALDDASVLDGLPYGAVLIRLPPGEPEFVEECIALGVQAIRSGRDVVFRHTGTAERSE